MSSSEQSEATAIPVGRTQILGLIAGLRASVGRLRARAPGSGWVRYEQDKSYDDAGQDGKDAFVERALRDAAPKLVWDLGANTGRFSLIAARHAETTVAMDGDPEAVAALYERLRDDGRSGSILPLLIDLTNPSPAQGWGGEELRALTDRGLPDLCLCLALVHHLAISGNVPLSRLVSWLAGITRAGVIEFVPKSDPMVAQLLRWREDVFDDYDVASFERTLSGPFEIREREVVPGSDRVLYRIERRK